MHDPHYIADLFSLESKSEEAPYISPRLDASSLVFLEGIHRYRSDALREIIALQGWPSEALMGEVGEAAAFMIVQHADYDAPLQRLCHELMMASATRGESKLGFLAFLTDRILCNEGKHQRFGTQLREVTNGCFVPKPIENPDRVDLLREWAGLGESLTDYLQRINNGNLQFYRMLIKAPEVPEAPPSATLMASSW